MSANNIGSSILKNLNLPGMTGLGGGVGGPNVMASMQGLGKANSATGGYQPKMFGAGAAAAGGTSQSMSISSSL